MHSHVRTLAFLAALTALLSSASAAAEEKASIEVLVAEVSTKGAEIDPALKGMAADLQKSKLPYTSFKLLTKASLSLTPGQSGDVKLPGTPSTAKVTLLKMEGAKARVKIAVGKATADYSMAPGGETYIGAGAHRGNQIFLAVKR